MSNDRDKERGRTEINRLLSRKDAENLLKVALSTLVKDYNITQKDVLEIFDDVYENNIPISIFSEKLNPSEAIVKFLKEEKGMTYHEIAEAINRDERGIWGSYHRAVETVPGKMPTESKYHIPLDVFKDRKFSILENVVLWMRDTLRLKNPKISEILGKNTSTIATIYNRAKKK